MLNRRPKYDVVEKFRAFRNIYVKIFTLFAGTLWIFSTILDIYNLQRYWLDYTAEFYGCFFLFIMMVFSINPKLLPVKIYNSFSLITTIRGKATLLIIISSIFLKDKHNFNQFRAFLLLIGESYTSYVKYLSLQHGKNWSKLNHFTIIKIVIVIQIISIIMVII